MFPMSESTAGFKEANFANDLHLANNYDVYLTVLESISAISREKLENDCIDIKMLTGRGKIYYLKASHKNNIAFRYLVQQFYNNY